MAKKYKKRIFKASVKPPEATLRPIGFMSAWGTWFKASIESAVNIGVCYMTDPIGKLISPFIQAFSDSPFSVGDDGLPFDEDEAKNQETSMQLFGKEPVVSMEGNYFKILKQIKSNLRPYLSIEYEVGGQPLINYIDINAISRSPIAMFTQFVSTLPAQGLSGPVRLGFSASITPEHLMLIDRPISCALEKALTEDEVGQLVKFIQPFFDMMQNINSKHKLLDIEEPCSTSLESLQGLESELESVLGSESESEPDSDSELFVFPSADLFEFEQLKKEESVQFNDFLLTIKNQIRNMRVKFNCKKIKEAGFDIDTASMLDQRLMDKFEVAKHLCTALDALVEDYCEQQHKDQCSFERFRKNAVIIVDTANIILGEHRDGVIFKTIIRPFLNWLESHFNTFKSYPKSAIIANNFKNYSKTLSFIEVLGSRERPTGVDATYDFSSSDKIVTDFHNYINDVKDREKANDNAVRR